MKNPYLFFCLFLLSPFSYSSCLDDVARFAKEICGELSREGGESALNAKGELTVKAEGLFKRIFGGSVGGSVEKTKKSYENVLREDLSGELKDIRACRIKMVEVGQKSCSSESGGTKKSDLIPEKKLAYVSWPQGRSRYLIETTSIRSNCGDEGVKKSHEIRMAIQNNLINLTLNGHQLYAQLTGNNTTIVISGNIPSEGGFTSFNNATLKLRNDGMIEADMSWVWQDPYGSRCGGSTLISSTSKMLW